jgi:hypothetical protein
MLSTFRVVAVYTVVDMMRDLADGGDVRAMRNPVRHACRSQQVAT